MIVIWQNLTETISADNAEANFPASNMLERHSKKRWRSGVYSATITASVGSGASALALHNLMADTADVTVDGVTHNYNLLRDDGWGQYRLGHLFLDYGAVTGTHTVTVDLAASADTVKCGLFFAGVGTKWTNPEFGAGIGAQRHSIVYDLDNGFEYIFKRNHSEAPSLTMMCRTKEEVLNFKRMAQALDPNPAIFKIENFADQLLYYARFDQMPSPKLSSFAQYPVSFTLKEFL